MPGKFGRTGPTDVTVAAENRTNRARSMATGVVSGAGSQPVFEKPHSDESASIRTRQCLDPHACGAKPAGGCRFGKAVEAAGACYGWCRAQTHTRKR